MTFVSVREPCRGTGKRGEAAKHLSHLSLKGQRPLWVAGSTGRRNTGVKSLCWVSNCKVSRGRSLSSRATLFR